MASHILPAQKLARKLESDKNLMCWLEISILTLLPIGFFFIVAVVFGWRTTYWLQFLLFFFKCIPVLLEII